MDVSRIPTGKAPPHDIYVMVEIPQGSAVKYEVDKHSGALFVDRFLFTATAYPTAYGFIPGTLRWRMATRWTLPRVDPDAGGSRCGDPEQTDRDAADGGRGRARREDCLACRTSASIRNMPM